MAAAGLGDGGNEEMLVKGNKCSGTGLSAEGLKYRVVTTVTNTVQHT